MDNKINIKPINSRQLIWEVLISSLAILFVILSIVNHYVDFTYIKPNPEMKLEVVPMLTFTIQSNLIVGIYFFLLFIFNMFDKKKYYRFLSKGIIKGGVAFTISVTGIIFGLVLYPMILTDSAYIFVPYHEFVTIFLHFIIPFLVIVNAILFRYQRNDKVKFKHALLAWYFLPIFYFVVAEVYGAITDRYAYFFLNPHDSINVVMGYYGGVFIWFFGLAIAFIPIILFYWALVNKKIKWLNKKI